ncbi:hypothetical protein [Cellulomonas sp. URHD0024]|uniref:hypothetical protein n=1 Tax=Cellulomonas sp. URHD0024 TaxID=1302620 RepID=UPI0004896897|nr:hypothetical protein [Cellulomonas sp. URHD0024]
MSHRSAEEPQDAPFLAARDRAAARNHGILAGRYVLADGELLPRAWGSHNPAGMEVVVPADYPGAARDGSGRWCVLLPHDRVLAQVLYETHARHIGGATLELRDANDVGDVRVIWWRGLNADAARTIPSRFVWEKNDDYYYGTVQWDDLSDVRLVFRR